MPRINIDGTNYEVAAGQNLLQTCLSLGISLPYFCWHPAMGSVGACRQCAVKQFHGDDQHGRIVMACMVEAADGARISVGPRGGEVPCQRDRVADDQSSA